MWNLEHYSPVHRQELQRLIGAPAWQDVLDSGLLEEVQAGRIEPGNRRDFVQTVVDQLLGFNESRVQELVASGCNDEERLFRELSSWPAGLGGKDPVISFLGLKITSDCNFEPRCTYCNQARAETRVDSNAWKQVVREVARDDDQAGPYVYITGGEPLLMGEDLWGDDGLVRFATRRGARVNINTNAALLTPMAVLRLIKAGLGNLHVSLDAADRQIQNDLLGADRFDQVLEGIYNVQLARDLVGVSHPVIHINCVLTNRNLDSFPELFAFILEKHTQTANPKDPLFNDLFPHIIPVGGRENDRLRPSEEEFRRFYEEIWPEVCEIWDRYQQQIGVAEAQRRGLAGYFRNPFLRVEHEGGLKAYVEASAEGRYGKLALRGYCYVAPTQASFTPDGCQYRCGSHAIRRILPIGNIAERGVFDSIRAGISGLDQLPQEAQCYGCALATLYINQTVETKLREKLAAILGSKKQAVT